MTEEGTSPRSFKVIDISEGPNVFRGNVVIRRNGVSPSYPLILAKVHSSDNKSDGLKFAVFVEPFGNRN